jgi:SSS family solute:Na+ symporter
LFAHRWRRAGITTDAKFSELRYTGKPAVLLRGFRALYLGLPINCLIIGWVNLALAKVLSVTLGWKRITAVLGDLITTGIYASLSGLRGVVVGDLVQFALAMIGTVALAYFALQISTMDGLKGLLKQLPSTAFQFTPSFHSTSSDHALVLPLSAFIAFLGIQWWASWHPGQEPGGGGYLAQRIIATKNEHHAQSATLWFALAHYCLRPWPWIIVALVSTLLYPNLSDQESGYALIMRDYLPSGLLGLLIGVFLSAYMSTVSTQLNWGPSYLVNDVYVRFLRPNSP